MTIFTVNPFDDGYFDNQTGAKGTVIKLCRSSWEKSGYPVKIFDFSSEEVIEAKEKYKEWIASSLEQGFKSRAADAIRLYILSLYPDLLYMDTDCYIMDYKRLSIVSKDKEFSILGNLLCAVHNGEDLDTPKKMLDEVYGKESVARGDKAVITESYSGLKRMSGAIIKHFPHLSPSYKILYARDIAEIESCEDKSTVFFYDSFSLPSGAEYKCETKDISMMEASDKAKMLELMDNYGDF